ncbi:MAG: hypothetical protein R2795_25570 [Saprospiraceae bacterium]
MKKWFELPSLDMYLLSKEWRVVSNFNDVGMYEMGWGFIEWKAENIQTFTRENVEY